MADNPTNQQQQQPADAAPADADAPKLTEREVEINGTKTTLQLNDEDMKRFDEQEKQRKDAPPVTNKARK